MCDGVPACVFVAAGVLAVLAMLCWLAVVVVVVMAGLDSRLGVVGGGTVLVAGCDREMVCVTGYWLARWWYCRVLW
jgi:hypothetical protein